MPQFDCPRQGLLAWSSAAVNRRSCVRRMAASRVRGCSASENAEAAGGRPGAGRRRPAAAGDGDGDLMGLVSQVDVAGPARRRTLEPLDSAAEPLHAAAGRTWQPPPRVPNYVGRLWRTRAQSADGTAEDASGFRRGAAAVEERALDCLARDRTTVASCLSDMTLAGRDPGKLRRLDLCCPRSFHLTEIGKKLKKQGDAGLWPQATAAAAAASCGRIRASLGLPLPPAPASGGDGGGGSGHGMFPRLLLATDGRPPGRQSAAAAGGDPGRGSTEVSDVGSCRETAAAAGGDPGRGSTEVSDVGSCRESAAAAGGDPGRGSTEVSEVGSAAPAPAEWAALAARYCAYGALHGPDDPGTVEDHGSLRRRAGVRVGAAAELAAGRPPVPPPPGPRPMSPSEDLEDLAEDPDDLAEDLEDLAVLHLEASRLCSQTASAAAEAAAIAAVRAPVPPPPGPRPGPPSKDLEGLAAIAAAADAATFASRAVLYSVGAWRAWARLLDACVKLCDLLPPLDDDSSDGGDAVEEGKGREHDDGAAAGASLRTASVKPDGLGPGLARRSTRHAAAKGLVRGEAWAVYMARRGVVACCRALALHRLPADDDDDECEEGGDWLREANVGLYAVGAILGAATCVALYAWEWVPRRTKGGPVAAPKFLPTLSPATCGALLALVRVVLHASLPGGSTAFWTCGRADLERTIVILRRHLRCSGAWM